MNNYFLFKEDTIAAISTPYGKSGIGIIKISGNEVESISKNFFGKLPIQRKAEYLSFHDYKNNEILDKGIVLFFKNPYSFTGEDILEFHAHGNPYMLNYILNKILLFPKVRLAFPGEFTRRAYLNNKLDLIQAESILNLINSNSLISYKSSINSFKGDFSKKIKNIIKLIYDIKILIETYIDFSYEEINIDFKNKITNSLEIIINKIKNLLNISKKSLLINKEINISIIGQPNVGKSSIFNLFINKNKSIITDISGTTRDIINENFWLDDNFNLNLIDTAGIHKTKNIIENIGIEKTKDVINDSDYIILVIDNNTDISFNNKDNNLTFFKNKINDSIYSILNKYKFKVVIVKNKSDLSNNNISVYKNFFKENISLITVSAKLNLGINLIKNHIKNVFELDNLNEIKFSACQRHINILQRSLSYLELCKKELLNLDISLLSDNISLSYKELSSILGLNNNLESDKILSDIFSKFCIGK